jgi:superfamily II DNA or RNA helicase
LGVRAGGYFDALIEGPSTLDLIEAGYLCPPVVFAPPAGREADLSGVKVRSGDYVAAQLEAAMDRAAITGDAVAHYRKHAHQLPAIAFGVTIAHAEHITEQFREAGYQAATLTGKTPDRIREQMIRDLGDGKLHVLSSCNTISEGTDIPRVAAAILLRPTASLSLCRQQIGRALRKYPGKDRAIILDHAGNTRRHGLPTDDVGWSLDGAKKRQKAEQSPAKQCSQCYAIVSVGTRACPECGFVWEQPESSQRSLPETQDGELEQIDAVAVARAKRDEVRRARTLEELIALGEQRGYKPGWAYHEWQRRHAWMQGRSHDAARHHGRKV